MHGRRSSSRSLKAADPCKKAKIPIDPLWFDSLTSMVWLLVPVAER